MHYGFRSNRPIGQIFPRSSKFMTLRSRQSPIGIQYLSTVTARQRETKRHKEKLNSLNYFNELVCRVSVYLLCVRARIYTQRRYEYLFMVSPPRKPRRPIKASGKFRALSSAPYFPLAECDRPAVVQGTSIRLPLE